jgi:hypothetical protein
LRQGALQEEEHCRSRTAGSGYRIAEEESRSGREAGAAEKKERGQRRRD